MKGVIAVQNIAASKLDVARLVRDAIVKIDDPAAVSEDLGSIKSAYSSMHSNLETAELCFYTKEGKECSLTFGMPSLSMSNPSTPSLSLLKPKTRFVLEQTY